MTDTPRTQPFKLGGQRTVSTTHAATPPQVAERDRPVPPTATQDTKPTAGIQRRAAAPRTAPRYDELERKEARLRPDQVAELSRLARELAREARKSRPAGETPARITDNTLIRVAVDMLLAHSDQLAGIDEEHLRRSVGLKS